MTNPVLVEVTRGGRVESQHRGSIAVVDASGRLRAGFGAVDEPIFPRSAVKPLQALPLVESGAADRYVLSNAELALACGSHSGEPRHTAAAARMLAAAGRGEADLRCGASWPLHRESANALVREGKEPSALHDNCSGKHAGFICLACHRGVDPDGYVEPDHPAQREVTATLADMTGATLDDTVRGVDGCSVPTYAVPLRNLAHAFARFVTGEGMAPTRARAAERLMKACWAEPVMIAGTGRYGTRALEEFGERLFLKGGAEGVYCCAFPALGLGVAVKADDGAKRAAETMIATAIAAFLSPDRAGLEAFDLVRQVRSRAGADIGEIRPVAGVIDQLRGG